MQKTHLIHLKSAQIVTPQGLVNGDLVLEDNLIKSVGGKYEGKADQVLDCCGLTILPGLIDTHVHLRDPGMNAKEDFLTGTQAAVAGGVTTVFDMPNTNPPTISIEALAQKNIIAQSKSCVNYNFFVGLTEDNFEEINTIQNIAGIKIFLGSSTGNLLVNDLHYLEKVFRESNHLLAIHAEDENIINQNKKKCQDLNAPEIHSQIRNRQAEIQAIEQVLLLAQKNPQTRIHICHLSTKEAVELIQKYHLPNLTAEASLHHLMLNEDDYPELGNYAKVNPPLRTKADNQALWKALKNGTIQTIATDHAPHLKSEKDQDYWSAPSGMPMLELTLPLLLNLAQTEQISLQEISQWTAQNPAQIFGIPNKGKLQTGFDADLVIVDLKSSQKIQGKKLFTKCKWTPFEGENLFGQIVYTFVNGKLVFEKNKIHPLVRGQKVYIN